MGDGVFDLTTAEQMLGKLRLEVEAYKADETARHAMNALLTGYHLREWVWHERLANDDVLKGRLGIRSKGELLVQVEKEHPQFTLVHAIANGSKHFNRKPGDPTKGKPADPITGKHTGAFSPAFSKAFSVDHLFIEADGKHHDVEDVLDALLKYWESFFAANLR